LALVMQTAEVFLCWRCTQN